MKRIASVALCLLCACSASEPPSASDNPDVGIDRGSVAQPDTGIPMSVATVVVEPDLLTLEKGTTGTLVATALDEGGEVLPAAVEWESSDVAVAEVTETGVVIGREFGTVEVTATVGGVTGRAEVRVTGPPVVRIEVSPTMRQMSAGDTVTMNVAMYDGLNAPIDDPRDIVFASSNSAVITVDATGLVTAVSAGNAEILTVVETVEAVSDFTVTQDAIDRVEVLPVTVDLPQGDSRQLVATAYVENVEVAGQTFAWSTSDAAIVTVDPQGFIRGVGEGSAVVTASAGGLDGAASINVTFVFSEVRAGGDFACGLSGGVAYCWGQNALGQLGRGGLDTTPAPVATTLRFSQLAVGAQHACGLAVDGLVHCWGAGSSTLAATGSGRMFSRLFAGFDSTCAVSAGELWCWTGGTLTPVSSGTFDGVALGGAHTCAILGTSAFCWGSNTSGQLGLNVTGGSYTAPQAVTGGFAFDRIVAGRAHTCGTTPGGASLCWGDNTWGQLGDGTRVQRVTPLLLAGGTSITRLSVGVDHSCGLTAQGAAYCWGRNIAGELGTGLSGPLETPTAAATSELFTAVSAGDRFTCALSVDGEPYCWGDGTLGQLGTGGTSVTPAPVGGL